VAYDPKCWGKLVRHEVYVAELATPTFLWWSRSPITFDCFDHPNSVPHLGQYPLVIDPIVNKSDSARC
jgi:hypothetical protein